LKRLDRRNNKQRKRDGVLARTWKRIKDMEDPFANSDAEGGSIGDEGIWFDVDGNLKLADTVVKDSTTISTGDNGLDDGVRLNVIEANAQLSSTPSHSERRRGCHKQLTLRAKYVNGTNHRGCAGLVPRDDELDDFGEEAVGFAAAIRRTQRRLERWGEAGNFKSSGIVARNDDSEVTTNGTSAENISKSNKERPANDIEDQGMAEEGVEGVDEDVDMSE